MEPSVTRTGNSQDFDMVDALREASASEVFASVLAEGHIDAAAVCALNGICTPPFVLAAIKIAQTREKGDEREQEEPLKNTGLRYVSVNIDGLKVALVSLADARRLIENAQDRNKNNRYASTASLPFYALEDIPQQFDLVKYCLEDAVDEGYIDSTKLALSFLVKKIGNSLSIESLLHPALRKLSDYDAANQSSLLDTLRVYLDHDRNAQRCASILYLHRNSLQYRVRRIQEIADIDLSDPDVRAYLRLSFLLADAL